MLALDFPTPVMSIRMNIYKNAVVRQLFSTSKSYSDLLNIISWQLSILKPILQP